MDRFQSLSVFVAVVDKGSFSAAAEALGMSRNMASRHVMALEEHLSARLINRTTRRVSLTSLGAAYYERARQILAELAAADREASLQSLTPRGRLRGQRSGEPSAPAMWRPPSRPTWTAFAEVEVELTLNDRYVDLVDEGFDLAIRIGRLADSRLIARRLGEIGISVCAAPDYLAAHGTPQHPPTSPTMTASAMPMPHNRDVWHFTGRDGDIEVKVKRACGRTTAMP